VQITKNKLRQIFQEEFDQFLNEQRRLTPPPSRRDQVGLELARKAGLLDDPPLSDKQVTIILNLINALSPPQERKPPTPPQKDPFKDWQPHIRWYPGPEDP
jgi:hypothetical protein